MNSLDSTKDLAVGFKTVAASASAALFRIAIMPIDTTKTVRADKCCSDVVLLLREECVVDWLLASYSY